MSSQRHKRVVHGYDSAGNTPYTFGESTIPMALLTDDVAATAINFKTSYFPTGTNFALDQVPTGMSLNASTGALTGTPTAVSGKWGTLTVTYPTPNGERVAKTTFAWEVCAASVAAGSFTVGVAATPVDFKVAYPIATTFAMDAVPTGMTFNTNTGVLSGTPTVEQTDASVAVTMFYKNGGVAGRRTLTWSWAVAAA